MEVGWSHMLPIAPSIHPLKSSVVRILACSVERKSERDDGEGRSKKSMQFSLTANPEIVTEVASSARLFFCLEHLHLVVLCPPTGGGFDHSWPFTRRKGFNTCRF